MKYKDMEKFIKNTFKTWEDLHTFAEESELDVEEDYNEFTEAAHDAAGYEGPLEDLLHDYNNLLEFVVDRMLTINNKKGEQHEKN